MRAGGRSILNGVSFALHAGEAAALIGPNGAGKSMLMRVLSGELAPHAGAVRLRGRGVSAYAPRALARHRAELPQSVSVAFPFPVAQIVAMGAGDRSGAAVDDLVDAALAEVDLTAFRERAITTLSGGEQQRAHLARALTQLACGEAAHGSGLLLLDEPLANLDLRHQIEVCAIVRRRSMQGTAVLAVIHDLNFAAIFGGRVLVMDQGRLVRDGAPEACVNAEILARVFRVSGGHAPEQGAFVLPHTLDAIRD